MAFLSVGNSWAGSRLMASTSSSVRWESTSKTPGCRFHHQRSQCGTAGRCPSGRGRAGRHGWQIRRAPSPDRRCDTRPVPAARAGYRATGADLFHHQGVAVQVAVRANALHQRIHRHDQHAALHGRQLIQRGQSRRDDFLMRREAVVRQRFPVGEIDHQVVGELGDFIVPGAARFACPGQSAPPDRYGVQRFRRLRSRQAEPVSSPSQALFARFTR